MATHIEPIPILSSTQRHSAAEALDLPHEPAKSLYIHVPFCFHKCHYCDFYSFVDSQDRQEAFVASLQRELAALAPHADAASGLNTVFIGGGTPSLLRPDLWRCLLATLDDHFKLDAIRRGEGEFTVECNPETVSPELMTILAGGAVNRVSVGAQSFNLVHLKTLERWHEPRNVQRALQLAADAGIERRSVDLIYAIPGQTLADVATDLDTALALDPGVEHVSAYCLTYEPNTAMTKRVERGDFTPIDEDLCAEMQTLVNETLNRAGFDRYEVSNFAKRISNGSGSAQSQHNLAYWRNDSWLAAGPSASGHVVTRDETTGIPAGARWKNVPRLSDWMDGVNATAASPVIDLELPDPRRTFTERLMMGIRLAEGLPASDLLKQAEALNSAPKLQAAAQRLQGQGHLQIEVDRWRLTEQGFLFADGVASELMDAVRLDAS